MFSELGRGDDGRVFDTTTRLVVETPVPQPPYNAVWRFYDEGDRPIDDQVAELLEAFARRSVTLMWLAHPTTPPEVRPSLSARGMSCAEEIFGMIADLDEIGPMRGRVDDVEIREVTADDPDEWVHLVSWRYGLDTDTSPYLVDMCRKALSGRTRLWIARVGNVPVSKVGLHVDTDGIAGIYGVVTTEHGRGRGLASMLTLTALHEARSAGAHVAVLHSTPMARSLYARLGFRDVAVFEAWAKPNTLHL